MKEVVIKIPDEIYEDIKNWKIHNYRDFRIPLSCLLEGTVLPKGHGDLIDRRELLYHSKCTYRYDCSASGGSQCDKCSDNCVEVRDIESASAVIETDRSEEE